MKNKLITLLSLGFAGALGAAPLVNTPIGNTARATYTDDSGVVRQVVSNTVVTRVSQIYGLDLVNDNTRIATLGSQVYYTHSLSNEGNGPDIFTLAVVNAAGDDFDLTGLNIYADTDQDGNPDSYTPITSTTELAPGQEFYFVVAGTVPATGIVAGNESTVTVTATSVGSGTETDSNSDTVTITNDAVMQVNKSISVPSGFPGDTATYTITYTNNGNTAATPFTITDLIPSGMTYVEDSARWSVSGATVLDDDAGGDPAGIDYDFGDTTANTATFDIASVGPGVSGFVRFSVTVDADQAPGIINNVADYDFESNGTPRSGVSNQVPFTVIQVAGVTLTPPAPIANASAGSTVQWLNTLTNTGTGEDTFDITIESNDFPAGTTFQLLQSDGLTPMTDSNGNGIPDTGRVGIGATYSVYIEANLPSSASSGPYTVNKLATSSFDDSVSDDADDVLTLITGAGVDLTNDAELGDPGVLGDGAGPEVAAVVTESTNPGTTTTFTLFVNNTGPSNDTFNLLADDDATFGSVNDLPSGWTVTFRNAAGTVITNTGSIASGASREITAYVTVPAGYAPGSVSIYFQALSPTSGAKDIIHDAVNVNVIRAISIQTDNVGQTFPGGSVVYSHVITNNGNVTEGDDVGSSLAFSLSNAPTPTGWTTTIHYDGQVDPADGVLNNNELPVSGSLNSFAGSGLAPGASIRLFVRVIAPLGASDGATLATRITATTTNVGYSSSIPAVVSNTDTTNVVRGDLTIVKEQAISLNNDGTLDEAYTTSPLTAPPGAAILYRITVTNVGSSDATAITVNDTVPANTTFFTDATYLPTITGGSVATFSAPANGAASPAALSFNIGTLTPSQTSVMTFRVLIDE